MSDNTETLTEKEIKISFKSVSSRNKRNTRKRNHSDDEDNNGESDSDKVDFREKLAETKELQKLRSKPKGISIIGLALGKNVTIEEELTNKDPLNLKTGGMINLHALKTGQIKVDDAYDVGIGTQFSAETNKRDEDEEMMKYIEEQLSKRKGNKIDDNSDDIHINPQKYLTPEEAALLALPDHLRLGSVQRSEEMLSNQMLNGIPEIDLGIEAKIRNIEATEEAKDRLLQEQKNKKDGPSHFVPTNMAVNFVQHNRFNIGESEMRRQRQFNSQLDRNTQQNRDKAKKATDDYHYDKFRKQFRRN